MRAGWCALAVLLAGCSTAGAAQLQRANFQGWESLLLRNNYIRVDVTPQLGGRILGYQLAQHPFLWSNPTLRGKLPPPTRLAPDGSWLNWGGDKLWPAPQGWSNADQWPGPPDPILDGSPQHARVLTGSGPSAALELTSPPDPKIGVQFSRVVRVFEGSSRVHVVATMTNVSDRAIHWGIWTVTQLNAANPNGPGWNPAWNTYMPLNAHSHFPHGYRVLFGDERNPEIQGQKQAGVLNLQYMWKVGKVGLDSSSGWLANVDGVAGYVFVQEFTYQPKAGYPDGSSIELWTNGTGTIQAWGRSVDMPTNPVENPYIVESELLSPQVRLQPRERASFTYDWYSANIGGDFPILSCNGYGCACAPLMAKRDGAQIRLKGHFGVFYGARLRVEFLNVAGQQAGRRDLAEAVSPLQPLLLDSVAVPAPKGAARLRLVLFTPQGQRIGVLAETPVQ